MTILTAKEAPGVSATAPRRRRRLGVLVAACCWGYAGTLLAAAVALLVGCDRWWPATLLGYGPRWLLGAPLLALVPAAVLLRPRALWLLLLAVVVVGWPIMGFRVARPSVGSPAVATLRIMTLNMQVEQVDVEAFRRVVHELQPDVIALQECLPHKAAEVFASNPGWTVQTGRGLCVASRHPIRTVMELRSDEDGRDVISRYEVRTPAGPVQLFNLHLPTPRKGLEPMLRNGREAVPGLRQDTAYRREQSLRAREWVGRAGGPILLAGDFNMPMESDIYRRCWSAFTNGFSSTGFGWGYTKFTRAHGIRIDHILAGPGWRFRRCWVGPGVGSDHRPLLADLEWAGRG